ncbi:unnamed protein product, partial [marine sediment metagenome]
DICDAPAEGFSFGLYWHAAHLECHAVRENEDYWDVDKN